MILTASFGLTVSSLLLLAVIIAFITCASILVEKNGNPILQRLLFTLLFSISVYYLIQLTVVIGYIKQFPFFIRGFAPIYYLAQPAIYFYVVVNLNEKYRFSKTDLLHLIPFLFAFIDNWGFYVGGMKYWKYWADSVASNYGNIAEYPGSIVKAKYNFILRTLLYISYATFSWRFFVNYLNANQEIKNQFVVKWLNL